MAQYTVNLTEFQEQLLLNDLVDIDTWIQLMVDGKIHSCKKRLAEEERQRLISEQAPTTPTALDVLCQSAFDRPEYKNRAERDAIAQADLPS